MAVVTGIADHYASAELVTLSGGNKSPIILDRRSVRLIEPGLPTAPYHHEGLHLPLEEVEPIIVRTRASVLEHARAALAELKSSFQVDAIAIQQSPYPALPDSIQEVLASYQMTCAADGMMYREALASQAPALGLRVHRYPRKLDPIAAASKALGCEEAQVETLLASFGKTVGKPWRKEHKQVAAAALCVLAGSAVPQW